MSRDAFKLDVVSIRLVRDAPIYSDQKLNSPQAAVHLVGEVLCDMDRELVCVINLKADGTPINCSFVSAGTLDYSVVNPRDMLKASILSNAARLIIRQSFVEKETVFLPDIMAAAVECILLIYAT